MDEFADSVVVLVVGFGLLLQVTENKTINTKTENKNTFLIIVLLIIIAKLYHTHLNI